MNSFVYFIANDRRRLVKIGTSENPRFRLSQLQTATVDELRIVAIVPGDERYESALHERFAEHAVAGEWFAFNGELLDFLSLLPSVDEDAKERAFRARKKPELTPEQKKRIEGQTREWLKQCRDGVLSLGVTDFASAIGADRADMCRAIHGQGRHFRYEWWLALREILNENTFPNGERDLRQALETP